MSSASLLPQSVDAPIPPGVSSHFVGLNSASGRRFPTGQHPCQALYWSKEGCRPSVVFMLTHYIADYTEHYLAGPLADLGYGVLGLNTRFSGVEDKFLLEPALDDMIAGVKWLREQPGIENVIFIGNSGGGSLMAALQAKAEGDPATPGADAFIFLNAHPGRADVLSRWIDPSVVDETDPTKSDPTLDIYNSANKPPFSQEFISRYREAQRQRVQRITSWAKAERDRLNAAGIPDRVFPVFRTMADLRFVDPTIDPSERPSPACYAGDPAQANRSVGLIARASTIATWLSMWSVEDSKARLEDSGKTFTVPVLVVQATHDVGVYPSDAQAIYDHVASNDKEIVMVPGAHFFEDSQESLNNAIQIMCKWVKQRF